jgi:hypothetical protein
MKIKSYHYYAVFMWITILLSCTEDNPRNTEPLIDPWLRERTPVSLRLEKQVGDAVIINDPEDDTRGTISVTLIESGLDLENVKLEAIELQYSASASVEAGETLDLSEGALPIRITAENGEIRTYILSFELFNEPLAGKYRMTAAKASASGVANAVVVEGGVSGNAIWTTLGDKPWVWRDQYNVGRVNGYVIDFVLEDVDPVSGNTSGTVTLTPGSSGYFDFTVNNTTFEEYGTLYQLIPQGASTWIKDAATGMISFYDAANNMAGECSLFGEPGFTLEADHTDKPLFRFDGYAFRKDFNKSSWWNGPSSDYYSDASRFFYNCRRILWLVTKE